MTSLIDALNAEAAKLPRQPVVPVKDARTMTDAEYAEAKRQVLTDVRQTAQKATDARQLAALKQRYSTELKP